jgi:hypothetical protein
MKHLIRKILLEKMEDRLLMGVQNEYEKFMNKYGDIINQYKKLKNTIDKLEHIKNIDYKLYVSKQKNGTLGYDAQVKYPFVDINQNQRPWINIYVGKKDIIDNLSQSEKDNYIKNKIESYLMKRFPL